MASIHVRILEVFPTHEPRLHRDNFLLQVQHRIVLASSWFRCAIVRSWKLPTNPEEHSTSNIQRRTSNGSANPASPPMQSFVAYATKVRHDWFHGPNARTKTVAGRCATGPLWPWERPDNIRRAWSRPSRRPCGTSIGLFVRLRPPPSRHSRRARNPPASRCKTRVTIRTPRSGTARGWQ